MLESILGKFSSDLDMLLPLLIAETFESQPDSSTTKVISKEGGFIAPRQVKIGDAKLIILGDFIGKQYAAKP